MDLITYEDKIEKLERIEEKLNELVYSEMSDYEDIEERLEDSESLAECAEFIFKAEEYLSAFIEKAREDYDVLAEEEEEEDED